MERSKEKISYVNRYLTSYEATIKASNSQGLFDEAKLFELFAQNICSLWFDQSFTNLNSIRKNYPHVDLLSADKKIYVQVSTTIAVREKIKSTIDDTANDKTKDFENIEKIIFFTLSLPNKSAFNSYKNGKISFDPKTDIISTDDILSKSSSDSDFLDKVYSLVKHDDESVNTLESSLENCLSLSESTLDNIDSSIGGDYCIDRTKEVDEIVNSDNRFFFVTGEAGVGKSVVCKLAAERYKVCLCARAEKIVESKNANDVWSLDLKRCLELLTNQPVLIFIDSLEFIADSLSRLDILTSIFNTASSFENVKIICSCRTSDKNSFLPLIDRIKAKEIEIAPLGKLDLETLEKRFPELNTLGDETKRLLSIPFYANIIVTYGQSPFSKKGISFRETIWRKVICLEGRQKRYQTNQIAAAVEKIATKRAKEFTLGVNENELDAGIVSLLLSSGVIVYVGSAKQIRLKYDIFEDVCFEQIIDRKFYDCKGKYADFFAYLDGFGRSGFRRYQIWVENKLVDKEEREEFLYTLIIDSLTPQKWYVQTLIGICSSGKSSFFFEEYSSKFSNKKLFVDAAFICNSHSFELRCSDTNSMSYSLEPIGDGRESLILIANKAGLFLNKDAEINDQLIRLILNYSAQRKQKEEALNACFRIISSYVEDDIDSGAREHDNKRLDALLQLLYIFSMSGAKWLVSFFDKAEQSYFLGNKETNESEEIIKGALKCKDTALWNSCMDRLLLLAESFLTKNRDDKFRNGLYYDQKRMAMFDACGLSKKAEEYDYDSSNSPDTYFFSAAIKCDFWKTATWIIHMLNYSIERLYTKEKGPSVDLAMPDTKEHKKFYSGEVLWNMAVVGGTMPTVLSDMLYILSQESLNKARELNGDARKDFCYKLRGKILSESNNIAPISIIALIGIEFEYAYPDYALVLLSSEELISDDLRRFAYCQGSLSIHLLENEMANAVGLPGFKKRYTPILDSSHGSLRECLAALKAFGMEKEGKEAFESIKNQFSEEESIKAFGIPLDTLDPSLSYIAQGNGGLYIVPKNMQKHTIDDGDINGTKLFHELDSLLDLKKQRQLTANDCMSLIKKSISNINSQNSAIYTKTIIIVSAEALMKDDLSLEDRNYLVSFFLDKVEEKRNGGVFVFDPEMSLAFFAQINKGISKKYRDRLLLLLFYSAFSFGDNSLSGLAKYAKAYICKDNGLTRKVFSCLLSLSLLPKETYSPLDQFPQNVITFRNDSEKNDYSARKEKINNAKDKIFRDQLIGDGQVDFNSFRVDEADLNYLAVSLPYSRIVFDDSHFLGFLSSVLTAMFAKMSEYSNDDRINFWSLDEASSFIDREIVKSDDAKQIIDALSGALPPTFNSQIEDFLKDCFSGLPLEFMDSYENVSRREKAKEKSCLLKETSVKFPLYQDIFERGALFSIFTFRNPNALAKCPTSFSYSDKRFLSDNIISLGRNHISDVLLFIHVFHVKELMPDLLQSIVTILKSPEGQEFMRSVKDNDRHILREIMLVSFSDYQDAIKKNVNYTKAFSLYCQLLMLAGIEESYIVFDDFLAH